MPPVKTDLCFRGLQLPNLPFFFFLTSCLVSIHPNQNPFGRNVQADDIYSDSFVKLAASDSWRKIKDAPSRKKIICGMGGDFGRSSQHDRCTSQRFERMCCVCVCVRTCEPVCIIQRTVVLPHRERSGDDCL